MLKKYLLAAGFVLLLSSYTTTDDVYICDSKGGKRYHLSKDCRGLSNCKAEIKKVTLTAAKESGKTLCGYED
ncbi:hypothetical protein [Flavobacterium psychrotrophum]|uniref:hypothetical protein n=1 Tax=Flavobacterium psychrotrophum TaxID=2294119 RepID=UPI000E3206F7|nr:hypothetical protein [Flavobacterium psychrotrophum]